MIEKDFWKPANCMVKMKPRMRLFYSAMVCSIVPYITKQAMLTVDENFQLFYSKCMAIGALNGGLIGYLAMCNKIPIIMGATAIGMVQGAVFCGVLRSKVMKQYNAVAAEHS